MSSEWERMRELRDEAIAEGLIEWVDPPGGPDGKRRFQVTAKGEAQLRESVDAPDERGRRVHGNLVRWKRDA